ncbi:hypothetical protein H632_c2874p0 [Helicosporidium sp. ATCC 50920]|nr:hypothetical protein H632_c2874p0 [Helicosporidium sp. ATCC 50920]|eukprot:KDD72806.1 hypothetical protein H632_c2874p0 [Helicosporidium sp. ATCC 50920]
MAAGVSSVLDAMQLETGILIDAYRAAAAHAKPLKKGAAAPKAAVMALDSSVLLRVLCHRAEHAASKFLKSQKIPKRLPAQSMSSRAAAVAGGAVAASLAPMHKEGSGRFSFKKK